MATAGLLCVYVFFFFFIFYLFCVHICMLCIIYRVRTKIYCFKQNNPHFSAFERHAKMAASELSSVRRMSAPKLSIFCEMLDYHVWGDMLKKARCTPAEA